MAKHASNGNTQPETPRRSALASGTRSQFDTSTLPQAWAFIQSPTRTIQTENGFQQMQALRKHASRCINLSLLKQGMPSMCTTAHMLRSCKSTRQPLNAWLRQVAPIVGAGRMRLSELDFVRSIFDLGSIPTTKDQQATVNFVWDATQAAIRSATRRRNGN